MNTFSDRASLISSFMGCLRRANRVVHHLQQEHHQSMKEGSHKKVQKIKMVQNGPPYLSVKKKFEVDSERKDME